MECGTDFFNDFFVCGENNIKHTILAMFNSTVQ